MSVDRKDLKPGDWIEVRDPNKRIAYGTGGAGAYKVVKVGRVNVIASIDVRFSPTGPWHHQEHKIPLGHIVRVIPPSELTPAVEETKMATRKTTKTRENDEEVPPDAEAAGAQYAQDQLKSDYFANWILDQLYEASRMDPKDVLPLETKQDAMEIAKNMLQQLQWDTSRDLEPREIARLIGVDDTSREDVKKFFKGFRETLNMNRTWLADKLLELKGQMRGGGVSEARRASGGRFKIINADTGSPIKWLNRASYSRAEAEKIATDLRGRGYTIKIVPDSASHRVRDYIAVDRRDRPVGPRHKGYSDAKREADAAGGVVKFVPSEARERRRPKAARSARSRSR